MRKLLVAMGLMMAVVASTGCTLYFDENDDNCPPGTYESYDDYGAVCIPDGGGYYCSSDYECAGGCYCDSATGTCVEAGYCTSDADCPEGTTCDESRGSCTSNICDSDDDCAFGSYCDETSGTCIPSWICDPTDPTACGTGYTCQDGTCVPLPCDGNEDCAAGCYCDPTTGGCIESCYCTSDADATSAGYGWCDEDRSTCMPGDPPLPACEELTTEAECTSRPECYATYRGLNCTDPEGGSCTDGEAMCTCESFVFDECLTGLL